MKNTLYFIWLQCALGISSSLRTQEILAAFDGNARAIHDASDYDRRIAGVFTNLQLDKLRKTPLSQAELIAEECTRMKLHALSPQDSTYPALLRQLASYPLALYVRGDLDFLAGQLPLALVGTRRASRKSVDIASRLSDTLVRAGCCVVSGGALGIDSAAHWGALHAGGKTIAVLGCGHGYNYLPENATLRGRIAEHGAVISEYPGNTPGSPRSFPTRNRIISGISAGTIIVEANEKSGSLITARYAAEQNREVFAVPGDAFGTTYTGGNKLIREGAKPVFSAMDVLEEFELSHPHLFNMRQAAKHLEQPSVSPDQVAVKRPARPTADMPARVPQPSSPPAPKKEPPSNLSALEQSILQCLSNQPLHIDDITKATHASLGELFAALTTLEINGLAQQMPGKIYQIVK